MLEAKIDYWRYGIELAFRQCEVRYKYKLPNIKFYPFYWLSQVLISLLAEQKVILSFGSDLFLARNTIATLVVSKLGEARGKLLVYYERSSKRKQHAA